MAPCDSACATVSALLANATTSCPPATSLCTMLAPIFPRPTKPSRMKTPKRGSTVNSRQLGSRSPVQRATHGCFEIAEPRGRVCQVHSNRAASPGLERREISRGLRGNDLAEGVRLSGNWDVRPRRIRNLQKHPGRRPSLVELPGRMEEPGPEPDRRRDLLRISNREPNSVQLRLVLFR